MLAELPYNGLRDGLGIIKTAAESEAKSESVQDNGGVYFVPALTGLGAPYWDQYARGTMLVSHGVQQPHTLPVQLWKESAFQVHELLRAMESDSGKKSIELRADGGAVENNQLMQFQADIFGSTVVRPQN